MNKLIYLILIGLSFGCCSPKITTRYISKGVILVPTYVSEIQNSKFCCVDTVVQIPEPMTYIGEGNIWCTIIGYDCFGNISTYEFYINRLKDANE